jgi:signal transduction histidine kinase
MGSEEQFRTALSVKEGWDFPSSRLVAELSHQMNSPLGTLCSAIDTFEKVFVQLEAQLKEGEEIYQELRHLAPLVKATIGTARQACERMDASMKTLRRYVNLDQANPRKIDVRECIEDTLALLSGSLKGDITVIKELSPVPLLECQPRELNIALMSLLSSSIENMRGSGEIRINTARYNGWVLIKIADTAEMGLSAEVIQRCAEIATMHQGEMTSTNDANNGNETTFRLPLSEPGMEGLQ